MNNAPMRRVAFALAVSCLAFIAACGTPPSTSQNSVPTQIPDQSAPIEIAKSTPTTPPPEPEIIAPTVGEVIGWRREDLSRSFGGANLVRRDLGAEIWQYRVSDCVLLVFLYPGTDTSTPDDLKVTHIDASGGKSADTCIHSVVKSYLSKTS